MNTVLSRGAALVLRSTPRTGRRLSVTLGPSDGLGAGAGAAATDVGFRRRRVEIATKEDCGEDCGDEDKDETVHAVVETRAALLVNGAEAD